MGLGCILVLFSAGIPEEIVYRWGLQTRLDRAWGRVVAIVVTAGDLGSVLLGTGLVMIHWGVDTLPSVASFLQLPFGSH